MAKAVPIKLAWIGTAFVVRKSERYKRSRGQRRLNFQHKPHGYTAGKFLEFQEPFFKKVLGGAWGEAPKRCAPKKKNVADSGAASAR